MAKVIECPCGTILRADADEELVRLAQEHALQTHSIPLSRDQALAMARRE